VVGAERYRLDRAVARRPYEFVTLSHSIATPGYRDRDLNRSLVYLYRVASLARGQRSPFSDSNRRLPRPSGRAERRARVTAASTSAE
jgi:hypothetical protein